MQLKYTGPFDTVEVPDLNMAVARGETITFHLNDLAPSVELGALITDLCAGDFEPADDEATAVLAEVAAQRAADEADAEPEPVTDRSDAPQVEIPDDYPTSGTIAAVMGWVVGTDDIDGQPDRAKTAIAIEEASAKPRTSLLEELTKVADTEATA